MKKSILSIILAMLLMLLCVSCEKTESSETTENTTVEQISSEDTTAETQTGSNTPAFGDIQAEENVQIRKKDKSLYVKKETQLSLPIIIDPYTYGHGGAEYTVDESIKEMLENTAERYYSLLDREYKPEEWEFDERTAQLRTGSSQQFLIMPEYIGFAGNDSKYNIDMTDDEIMKLFTDEPYLNAMVKFAGITKPILSVDLRKEGSSFLLTARLYNDADSISEKIINSQFNYVEFRQSENSEYYYFRCHFMDMTKKAELNAELITYEAAAASLENNQAITDCAVIYSSDIKKGYYIPCFVFYNEASSEKNDGSVNVSTTWVPMYSITEAEE